MGRVELFALRDRLGLVRNVIVQATCHGADNRAMVDALRSSGGLARGFATVKPGISEAELTELHEASVRGVRFNFVRRLVDAAPREALLDVVEQIVPFGWHVVLYFEAADLPDLRDFFLGLAVPLVIDHMGRPDVSRDPDGPEFEAFLDLLRAKTDIWCKVTCPERLSLSGLRRSTASRRRTPTWCRSRAASSRSSPTARCGAPTGRTPTSAITCLTTACSSTSSHTSHPRRNSNRRCYLMTNPMRLYWP